MKIIVLDTETTGLVNSKEKDLSKQPHMIQFAGVIGEVNDVGDWKREKEINIFIRPPIPIPYEASQVHNIYDGDLLRSPTIDDVIIEVASYINEVDLVVGHNISFDLKVIEIEIQRAKMKGIQVDFQPKNIFCTMENTKELCKLKNKASDVRYKRPKLWELHKYCFGKAFTGAHDAIQDVNATGRCFIELYRNGKIFPFDEANKLTLF